MRSCGFWGSRRRMSTFSARVGGNDGPPIKRSEEEETELQDAQLAARAAARSILLTGGNLNPDFDRNPEGSRVRLRDEERRDGWQRPTAAVDLEGDPPAGRLECAALGAFR